jgi:hypothetical protein
MKNKDINEWLLDEGIDPLGTVSTKNGEFYLSDILEKHLKEQLELTAVGCPKGSQLKCEHSFVDDVLMGVKMKRCWKCGKGEKE